MTDGVSESDERITLIIQIALISLISLMTENASESDEHERAVELVSGGKLAADSLYGNRQLTVSVSNCQLAVSMETGS